MQDGCRILGSGKYGKMAKKYQHHKLPSCLGYPKHEGKDEENLTHFFGHYQKMRADSFYPTLVVSLLSISIAYIASFFLRMNKITLIRIINDTTELHRVRYLLNNYKSRSKILLIL